MTTGAWVLLAAVAAALAVGLYRAYVDGRFRGTHPLRAVGRGPVVEEGAPPPSGETRDRWQHPPRWRRARRARHPAPVLLGVLRALPGRPAHVGGRCPGRPGVAHVELDAEHHLDLVRRLGVLRTPTTLVLDAAGREVRRASGAPRKEQVLAALEAACP